MRTSDNLILQRDDDDIDSQPVSSNASTLLRDFKQAIGLLILLSVLLNLVVHLLAPAI